MTVWRVALPTALPHLSSLGPRLLLKPAPMLLNILLTLLIIVAVSLTAVILLQRSEGGALGMGGGSGQFMTARGAGNLLTQTTQVLGALFFILSLAITILAGLALRYGLGAKD